MIIPFPNDGTGNLYTVVDLLGFAVHSYRDRGAAERALEGDQRIVTWFADGTRSENYDPEDDLKC